MQAGRVLDAVRPLLAAEDVPWVVAGLLHGGRTSTAVAGEGGTVAADVLVRASSNTKPLVAALALALVAVTPRRSWCSRRSSRPPVRCSTRPRRRWSGRWRPGDAQRSGLQPASIFPAVK